MSEVNEPKANYSNMADKDYLRRCYKMTPEQRFEAFEAMMALMNETMSPTARKRAQQLRDRL